jgi:hypothetical protein
VTNQNHSSTRSDDWKRQRRQVLPVIQFSELISAFPFELCGCNLCGCR